MTNQDTPTLSLAGQLLLAMPDMPDPRFERSVILICVHDEGGALGIALHEPMEGIGLSRLLASFEIACDDVDDAIVLAGGPMEPRRGFVLHSGDWIANDSHLIAADIALTGSLEVLTAIAGGVGPKAWLVALGYAGWGEGQLDMEMSRHGWFNTPGETRLLYDVFADERWEAAFASAGIDPRMLAASAGTA